MYTWHVVRLQLRQMILGHLLACSTYNQAMWSSNEKLLYVLAAQEQWYGTAAGSVVTSADWWWCTLWYDSVSTNLCRALVAGVRATLGQREIQRCRSVFSLIWRACVCVGIYMHIERFWPRGSNLGLPGQEEEMIFPLDQSDIESNDTLVKWEGSLLHYQDDWGSNPGAKTHQMLTHTLYVGCSDMSSGTGTRHPEGPKESRLIKVLHMCRPYMFRKDVCVFVCWAAGWSLHW